MVANDPAAPRNAPNMLRVPFIFVKRGEPPPLRWMAEHPGYLKVPAIMVPHGAPPPWPWGGARARPPQAAQEPTPTVEPRIPGSFAPPPKRRKRQPGGQAWPKDKNGRDWPQDRWGRPMRPLWDYPPGVRAPGEGVAPGEPGSVSTADAINAYLQAEAMLADPLGMARAALAKPDPANVSMILAKGPAAAQTDALGTQVATVLLMDDTPQLATTHTSDNPEQEIDQTSENRTTVPRSKSVEITNTVHGTPSDAVQYTAPDGAKFYAPPYANFREVYEYGRSISTAPGDFKKKLVGAAVGQGGIFDYQRHNSTEYLAYVHASNYTAGVVMNAAGYSLAETIIYGAWYATTHSSHGFTMEQAVWWIRGWRAAARGDWGKTSN